MRECKYRKFISVTLPHIVKFTNKFKMKRIVTILLLAVTFSGNLFAWGTTGHRVIAQIAEQNLTKKAKKQVNKALEGYPMAYWADWADNIKSDETDKWVHTHKWHFVNFSANLSKQQLIEEAENVKQDNVYSEIPKLSETIKNKTSTVEEKRFALYFLIHLVGDLHQPMHIGREEDLGGNKINVSWFNAPTNIHSVWDSKLIDHEKYSYTEYAQILNILTKEQKKSLQKGSLEDWLFETYEIANEIYATIEKGDKLSFKYPYKYKNTVELQLQRAGLRLAALLNEIFK